MDGNKELDNEITNLNHTISFGEVLRCNICGQDADFIVQLELVEERSNYNVMEPVNQMPFYLCKSQ